MAAKFGKATEGKRKIRPIRPSFWNSLRFKGPILIGLLVGSSVYGAGQLMGWRHHREAALQTGQRLVATAEAVHLGAQKAMEQEDASTIDRVLQHVLRSEPDMSVLVTDPDSQVVARRGPDSEQGQEQLTGLMPAGDDLLLGSLAGKKMVEFHTEVNHNLLGHLGTIIVRVPLERPAWLAMSVPLALGAAAYAAILTWIYLVRSMRTTKSLLHVLDRVSKEEYFHRAPESGCGEIVAIARAANRALTALEDAAVRVQRAYFEIAEALASTVEAKDNYTSGHSQRVARLACEIGEWLGFDHDQLEMMHHGGLLHDIGKVATPDAVLLKPGALNDAEFEEMKKHPMAGDKILSKIPGMRDIADIARSHHERWDGKGYPLGQAGTAIPLEGRIVAIADAYDAMVTKRSYKPAMPIEKALAIIEKDAGVHFDPDLARLFVKMKRAGKGYKAVKPKPGEMEGLPPDEQPSRSKRAKAAAQIDPEGGDRDTGDA